MNKLLLLITLFFLISCGPQEIGKSSYETPDYAGDISAADTMRFPIMGANRLERSLYYYNKPEIMQQNQSNIKTMYLKKDGH